MRKTFIGLAGVALAAVLVFAAVRLLHPAIGPSVRGVSAERLSAKPTPTVMFSPSAAPSVTPSPTPLSSWIIRRVPLGGQVYYGMALDSSAVFALYTPTANNPHDTSQTTSWSGPTLPSSSVSARPTFPATGASSMNPSSSAVASATRVRLVACRSRKSARIAPRNSLRLASQAARDVVSQAAPRRALTWCAGRSGSAPFVAGPGSLIMRRHLALLNPGFCSARKPSTRSVRLLAGPQLTIGRCGTLRRSAVASAQSPQQPRDLVAGLGPRRPRRAYERDARVTTTARAELRVAETGPHGAALAGQLRVA